MLKTLRKKGFAKKIIWFIAIVIIISFGFLGTAYLLTDRNQSNIAGKIFGKKINTSDFSVAFRDTRNQAIMQHGNNFFKIRQYLNLRTDSWDRLILIHEADKLKVTVSDADVIQQIESLPFFQRDNQFDSLLYNELLSGIFEIQPRDFEEAMRQNLRIQKLLEKQTDKLTVTEKEAYETFAKQSKKVQISYALIPDEKFINDVSVSEVETRNYFNDHKFDFLLPPSINVEYVLFPITENDPATDESSDQSVEKTAAENKAEEFAQTAIALNNLTEPAKNMKLELKESGFISKERITSSIWPFRVLTELFKLNLKEIAGPFETPAGFYVCRIKEKQDASIPDFDSISKDVGETLKKSRSSELALSEAQTKFELIKQKYNSSTTKDFPEIVKDTELEVYQTEPFQSGQYLPRIGLSKEFQDAAFDLSEDQPLAGPIKVENGYTLLHLDSIFPADESEFAAKKDKIKEALLQEKQSEMISDYMTKIRIEAKLEDNLPEDKN